jgi:hypothetical protein
MTARRTARLLAVLTLLWGIAACGGGDDPSTDAVASLDDEAAADAADTTDDEGGGRREMSPEEQAEFEDAMLAYAECMRDHGIDMPDPEFDGGRVTINGGPGGGPGSDRAQNQDDFEAADEECRSLMEDALPEAEPLDPEEQAEMQDRLTAMAECMRERGHDMPDPQVSEGGGVEVRAGGPGGDAGGGPPDDEFEQDLEECQDEAGMEGPGGGLNRSTDDGGEA